MCDYSLHTVANRPAEVAETLVTTKFRCSGTRGFASPTDSDVAVCLRPGTEIAFEKEVQTGGLIFRKDIGDRLARFRQINLDRPAQHHDALEFSNGAIVLVTNLASGQRATVLQLPAKPMRDAPPSLARAAAATRPEYGDMMAKSEREAARPKTEPQQPQKLTDPRLDAPKRKA